MSLRYKWDQRSMHRIRHTLKTGTEIHRGCLITGLENENQASGTDPEAFLRVMADADFPQLGSTYPTTIYPLNSARLEEILPETTGPDQANNSMRVDFVYRINVPPEQNGGDNVWTVTEGGQGSYVDMFATAAGGAALTVWYRREEPSSTKVYPTGTNDRPTILRGVRGMHKFYPQRTLRVTGQLYSEDWYAVRNAIRAASGKINSDTWGGDPRGAWLFLFPIARTTDLGRTFFIELNFLHEVKGHFPVGIYRDSHGDHPADCATEANLREDAPPPFNTYAGRNGIMWASVYYEEVFTNLFAFGPNDVPLDPNALSQKQIKAEARHAQ